MEWAIGILKWLIGLLVGILALSILYVITSGLCRLGYAARESGWGVFLLIVLPLALAGILFYVGAGLWIALGIGAAALGLMVAGRAGFIITIGPG